MKVVISDIEAGALSRAEKKFNSLGGNN